jgi:NAD(P)-dependent dehydrogenase (short-subunit alcohol dehydrogenase family)
MFSLNGKFAVVTGAGSGIGEAIAHALAEAGAVTYVAELDAGSGTRVAASLPGQRGRHIDLDVADEASCQAAAAKILSESGGRCDVLVNNAGIGHVGTALTTTPADLDRMYAVNVRGLMQVTQAFLPTMIRQRRGSVVNLASIGGVVGIRDRLAYCATKFAVVGLTKCMALDHADARVRFNAICPGRVETPFVRARLSAYADPEKAYREMSATHALGRMATADEIAASALYLASDESSFVTGSTLIIDGGFSAGK